MSDARKRLTRESASVRKSAKKKTNQVAIPEIELVEDAWPRFEALVKSAAKMGHKPHGEELAARKRQPGIAGKRGSTIAR